MKWWHYVIAVVTILAAVLVFTACSHVASDLAARQRAIQNCIINGGTPSVGPDNSIVCD